MLNKEFCYWLQGYFEIAEVPTLNRERITLIEQQLSRISEPLGPYTQWLQDVLHAIQKNNYHQPIIDMFAGTIPDELNKIFLHDIDNSYATQHSPYELHQIHIGAIDND